MQGTVSVDWLSYDQQRFGDGAHGTPLSGRAGQQAKPGSRSNSIDMLAVRYRKEGRNPSRLTAIPGLPLQRLNLFLPGECLQLWGISPPNSTQGSPEAHPRRRSALRRHAASASMIGTAFTLADDTIRFDRSRLVSIGTPSSPRTANR